MKRLEHSLQVAVAHMLQLVLDPERTWWTAIDHAAKLGVKVNRKTGKRYSPQGQDRQRRGVKRGLPDFILMVQGEHSRKIGLGFVLGLELKVGKGTLSPEQREVRDAWSAMGHGYYVARSLAEVQKILDHCHVPMLRRMTLFLENDGGGHERLERSATAGHRSKGRRRKSKSYLPVVLARAPQA